MSDIVGGSDTGGLEVEASGSLVIDGGTSQQVDQSSAYAEGFYVIAIKIDGGSADNGVFVTKWDGTGTTEPAAVIEETAGNTSSVSWATVKLSD